MNADSNGIPVHSADAALIDADDVETTDDHITPRDICKQFDGTHHTDPAFIEACKSVDWDGFYPTIDADGNVNGCVDADEMGDYEIIESAQVARRILD